MKPANLKYQPAALEGFIEGTLGHLRQEVICRENPVKFPLMLNIEPTNDCNLSCYVCARRKSRKKIGYMDFSLFEKIVNEAADYPPLYMLNFHKDGESLLHPELPRMISMAKKKKISRFTHLNTNGVLLSGKTAKEILDSGLDDITVSIDAARRETFKRIKGKDLFNTVEKNVKDFIDERRRRKSSSKPFLRVKIMDFSDTEEEIDEFVAKWRSTADEVQVSGIHDWAGGIKEIKPSIYIPKKRYPCIYLWYALALNWDGGVGLCCVDWRKSNTVGDANKEALHAIWQNPKLKKIRLHHINGDYEQVPSCRSCDNWAGGEDLSDWMKQEKAFIFRLR